MSSEWKKVKLKNLVKLQEGYVNPKQSIEKYFGSKIKWLRAVDLNNSYVFDTTRKLSEKGFNSAGKSALLFKPDTLAISKSGTIGRLGILKDYMCGNRAVINIEVDKNKCDLNFIFYVLLLKNREIKQLATGSVQQNLYTSALGSLEFKLPPLSVQKLIADKIFYLDEKIRLNQQTNQTLEAMAQTIFKSWFVDFDPVRAKIWANQEGYDPERAAMAAIAGISLEQDWEKTEAALEQKLSNMTEARREELKQTASLFPDELEESELGEVPEGWEVPKAGAILERYRAPKRIKKDEVKDTGSTVVLEQGEDIILGFHDGDAGFEASVDDPYFIFGDHTCVTHLSVRPFDVSVNVIPLSGNKFDTYWTYYAVNGLQEFQEYKRHWSELKVKNVLTPTLDLDKTYAEVVKPLIELITQNRKEILTLEGLRDTLLPKLISGEIEV